jgi:PAS domain S-box-containing protein
LPQSGLVLVVDDDTSSTDTLCELLEGDGYAVQRCPSGQRALASILAAQPNLVLLSARLPDADAFGLLAQLRKSPGARDIPVIVMTALDDVEGRVEGLESGDDLIVKPFDSREVLARIERQVTVSKVRAALRESEAKFRSVMESAIDAIISGDDTGHIRSWNSAAAALFGYTESQAIGEPIELIIPERYRRQHQQGIQRVSSGGPSHVIGKTVELAALRKDGTEFPVELSLATWFLDETRYYTGIIRDISERKEAEQKFRSVTESAIDAIISADCEGRIMSWNGAATRILGYTEEEALGRRLELIIPERFHEAHRRGMARYTATGKGRIIGTTVELFARRKDGREVPIELSLSTWMVRDERYYTGIIRDIGERKTAEEALRASEQALRDKSEELKRKNEVLEGTLHQLREAQGQLIIQEKMASLGKLSAGMAHELNNPAAAAQRGAAQLEATSRQLQAIYLRLVEQRLERPQLERLAALCRFAWGRSQEPVALPAITRSDRETALAEWLEAQGIEPSAEQVTSLVNLDYGAEELSDLATVFPGGQFSLVLEWLSCSYSIFRQVGLISLGTGHIAQIVKALKSYTYMDQAPVQSVDVREGLDNTLIILQGKLKRGISVHREYADDLPLIQAFASELNQVWTNIIDNAVDAMNGEGTLVVRARAEGRWVVVEIEDDGPGIPPEIQSKVFDPFFTTKGPGGGTGLGLNISRNLVVQKHQGQITFTSTPRGTNFQVRLPIDARPSE